MTIYTYPQVKENKDVDITSMLSAIETAIPTRRFKLYPAKPEFYVAVDEDLTAPQKTTLDGIVPPYLV